MKLIRLPSCIIRKILDQCPVELEEMIRKAIHESDLFFLHFLLQDAPKNRISKTLYNVIDGFANDKTTCVIVSQLIKKTHYKTNLNNAFLMATRHRKLITANMIEQLFSITQEEYNIALYYSARYGFLQHIKYLVEKRGARIDYHIFYQTRESVIATRLLFRLLDNSEEHHQLKQKVLRLLWKNYEHLFMNDEWKYEDMPSYLIY